MKRSGIWALSLIVITVLFPLERGGAQSVNTTIPVTVTVGAGCSISGTGLNFGIYVGSQLTSTGTITVTCSQDRFYNVTLSGGLHRGAGTPRALRNLDSPTAGVRAEYFLYKDPTMGLEWGDFGFDGTYPGGTPLFGTGTGSPQTLTIYGRLSAVGGIQGAAPGSYTDTVVATLFF
jgi:spore coat protein U-like protein